MKNITIALIGNQNCGKTTLFNQLTGSNQHVGNFPGVTVEKKLGMVKKRKNLEVVDLPGIYSLSPFTAEEVVTRDFLTKDKPDAVINIIDATNIERNLYLTLQLVQLNLPVVIALNMMDEVRSNGNYIDIAKLEKELGVPVVPISASQNDGISELVDRAIMVANKNQVPQKLDFCQGAVHKAIHSIAHLVESAANEADIPVRFATIKLVEGDTLMEKALKLSESDLDIIFHIVTEMEKKLDTDRESALADMRYEFIQKLCRTAVVKTAEESREQLRTVAIDRVLTHKYFGIPIFIGIMITVFWMTFGVIGSFLSDLFSAGIDSLTEGFSQLLTMWEVNEFLHSFVIEGVFAGVGSVLSFLPTIVVLFFFLSMLEDSGYMARVAFVMDKLLRKIGLSGRSFVPLIIGFGCSVPAIMATRTLPSQRDRKMTMLLTPFMSCNAKLPIYASFTAVFFPDNAALVMSGLYFFGMLVGIIAALIYKKTIFSGKPVPFIMELPTYRLPSLKSVVLHMWDKAKDFLTKAFTIIFVASVAIWLLQTFNWQFNIVEESEYSILASLGRLVAPIFAPLGFSDWRAVTALVTGLTAKEAVISTLAVLTETVDTSNMLALRDIFANTAQVVSFLVFTLLYMPCVAAMAAFSRELSSFKKAVAAMLYQTILAWIVAFVVYNIVAFICL